MESSFRLDPCHVLTIKTTGPAATSDHGVLIGLTYTPLPCNEVSPVSGQHWTQPWTREMHFRPPEARAIGSAIIGASILAKVQD